MDELIRMKEFYKLRKEGERSLFNCYAFFLDCKQTYCLIKILKNVDLKSSNLLDIGAGEGNFILKMISLGFLPKNIFAIEYLEDRFRIFREKHPSIEIINNDFLNVDIQNKYRVITLMAVLTSIIDNDIRYKILTKALNSLSKGGFLILYDYFNESEALLSDNYRVLSLSKVCNIAKDYKIQVSKKVYLKAKYAKGLCKFGLKTFIPLVESLRVFNDSYHFVVIKNEE